TQRVAGEGDAVKLSVDVRGLRALAINRFRSDEAPRRETDTLVLDRWGTGFLRVLGVGLLLGHGGLEDFVAGLQVADRGIEGRGGGLHFSSGIDRLGSLGAGFRSASVGGRRSFARFVN